MKETIITADLEQQIIKFYSTNTARSTAKYFHIRPDKLNKILDKYNTVRHATIKTELSAELINELLSEYTITSDLELCKKFHITKTRLHKILVDNNIAIHTEQENRHFSKLTKNIDEEAITSFYKNDSMSNTCKYFHISPSTLKQILIKNNINLHTKEQLKTIIAKNKSKGLKQYYQTNPQAAHRSCGKACYKYGAETFDSSWELALWIYANEHNETIIHNKQGYEYYVDNIKHYYFPDFIYNGKIIEVKGDHMLTNGQLNLPWQNSNNKTKAKMACMNYYNIEIWPYEKIKFALDFVKEYFGKNYLGQFKVNKNKN